MIFIENSELACEVELKLGMVVHTLHASIWERGGRLMEPTCSTQQILAQKSYSETLLEKIKKKQTKNPNQILSFFLYGAQWLRALVTLIGDRCLIPSTLMVAQNRM